MYWFLRQARKLLFKIKNPKDIILNLLHDQKEHLLVKNKKIIFSIPNWLCRWRANNFLIKEPDTIKWINTFKTKDIFWDIGANNGNFSIYAAKFKQCRCYAFEPSVFNLEILARNIFYNRLEDNIVVVPLAVGAKTGPDMLHMSSTELGGAFSSFSEPVASGGEKLNVRFRFSALALSLDNAVEKLGLPQPDHLKIDVDGLEHRVLEGGPRCLQKIKSALVEMTPGYRSQESVIHRLMTKAGLVRCSNTETGYSGPGSLNVIWMRK